MNHNTSIPNRSSRSLSRPAWAFTLIELLVVISIIALLIAILLPALKKARQQALRTVCISNQRQIALGMIAYANDNNGVFPDGHARWYNHGSFLAGVPNYWVPNQDFEDNYLSERQVYYCPEAWDASPSWTYANNDSNWNDRRTSYLYWPRPRYDIDHEVTLASLPDTAVLGEYYNWAQWLGFQNKVTNHNGEIQNFAYVDGHVITTDIFERGNPDPYSW